MQSCFPVIIITCSLCIHITSCTRLIQLQRKTTDKVSYRFKPQRGKAFRISTQTEKIWGKNYDNADCRVAMQQVIHAQIMRGILALCLSVQTRINEIHFYLLHLFRPGLPQQRGNHAAAMSGLWDDSEDSEGPCSTVWPSRDKRTITKTVAHKTLKLQPKLWLLWWRHFPLRGHDSNVNVNAWMTNQWTWYRLFFLFKLIILWTQQTSLFGCLFLPDFTWHIG